MLKNLSIKKISRLISIQFLGAILITSIASPITVQAYDGKGAAQVIQTGGSEAISSKYKELINLRGLYSKAISDIEIIPKGSLDQAKKAIEEGTLRVAFVGDSITEGADLSSPSDNYVNQVQTQLKEALPGVAIEVQNFSLGARGFAQLISDEYKAVDEETNFVFNFHRDWSVTDKSWKDHVKDFKPDLLIIAFGMNDANGYIKNSDEEMRKALDSFVGFTKTWEVAPDLVLVPTILPTKDVTRYNQRQDITNSVALVTREYAKEKGYVCADANRLFQILRDEKDVESTYSQTENNLERVTDFLDGTISFDAVFNATGIEGGRNILYRSSDLGSIIIQMQAKEDGTGVISLYASDNGSIYGPSGKKGNKNIVYETTESGNVIVIVEDESEVELEPYKIVEVPGVKLNTSYNVKIEADGIKHKVYINNVLQLEFSTYSKLVGGKVSFKPTGPYSAEISNIAIEKQVPYKEGSAFTEDDLLGRYNEPGESGNGINHPSSLGMGLFYTPAFNGVIKELKDSYHHLGGASN
ncbi:SGNH/GDSL hydrolase family protein [Clostridium sp.]|uniref:SGNH/GDSL hydrolase family protein n=1 Tax=Clostridium sp. TaxID=1506 RepID=UPI002FCC573F